MTLSSADNSLQTIWTQIRLDILSRPYRGPDCLTLWRLWQAKVEPIYFNNAFNIYMTLSSADNSLQTVWTQIRLDILSRPYRGPDCLTLWRLWQAEVEPIYFNNVLNIYMTLSSADNPLQTIWTQIRLDILSWPYQGPDCLTLWRLWQAEVEPIYFNNALNIYMTLSSADNSLQTVWTQIRPDILTSKVHTHNVLTLHWKFRSGPFSNQYSLLSVCLSVYLSVCLAVRPSVRPSIHPSIHLSIYLLYLSVYPSIQPSPHWLSVLSYYSD